MIKIVDSNDTGELEPEKTKDNSLLWIAGLGAFAAFCYVLIKNFSNE